MTDDLKKRQPQDGKRINVNEDWELEYWTEALGASKDQLKAAVKAVGVQADDVRRYLTGKK